MTTPVQPYPAQPYPAPSRLSKSALLSFICGLLGCIPFATGALAILLGLIGFIRTGKPGVRGRWMAVVGTLLGIVSLVCWFLFFGSISAIVWGAYKLTEPPATATHDFIMDLSNGDTAGAKKIAPHFADEKIAEIEEYLKKQGAFKDTTFPVRNVENSDATIEGTADFSGGTQNVKAKLEKNGDDWEMTSIEITPK